MLPISKQNITEVWSSNLIQAFKDIKDQIKNTSYVAFDSEFPGAILPKTRETDEWTYIDGTVRRTNPIQFGLAFYGEFENKIIPINTWQINFKFDEDADEKNPDGIKFLKEHGFDFDRHKNEGCTPGCLHERTAFALRIRYIYIADIYVYLSTIATIRAQRQRSGNRTSKCQSDVTRDNTRRWQRDSSSYRARARRAQAQHSTVVLAAQRVVEPRRGGSGASIDFRQNALRGAHHHHYYYPRVSPTELHNARKQRRAHCASIIGIWSKRTWLCALCIRCLLPESHREWSRTRRRRCMDGRAHRNGAAARETEREKLAGLVAEDYRVYMYYVIYIFSCQKNRRSRRVTLINTIFDSGQFSCLPSAAPARARATCPIYGASLSIYTYKTSMIPRDRTDWNPILCKITAARRRKGDADRSKSVRDFSSRRRTRAGTIAYSSNKKKDKKKRKRRTFLVTFIIIIICYTFQRAANYINISRSCGSARPPARIYIYRHAVYNNWDRVPFKFHSASGATSMNLRFATRPRRLQRPNAANTPRLYPHRYQPLMFYVVFVKFTRYERRIRAHVTCLISTRTRAAAVCLCAAGYGRSGENSVLVLVCGSVVPRGLCQLNARRYQRARRRLQPRSTLTKHLYDSALVVSSSNDTISPGRGATPRVRGDPRRFRESCSRKAARYSVAVARDLLRRRLRYQHRARAHEQAAEIQRESRSAAGVGRKRWLDTTLTYLHGAANLQSRFMVFMLIILPFGTGNTRRAATYCARSMHMHICVVHLSYAEHDRLRCARHTTADQPAAPPPAAISMPGGTQAAFAPREQIWPIVVSLVKQAANDHHLRMSDCSARTDCL
ncbi:unnamed protein product [Trichogramma brassicae]|uniref:poly(A)-specific ribonuclease n=1 Tax=Trichogramma brassicae TaxID=86971 RepID=A0A6H5HVE2_9HYME|nr:unnamed protein product [Trichogramma brassicae]